MNNLTIIYYTANLKHEKFAERIRQSLLKTIKSLPLISVSQKPLVFGHNICLKGIGRSIKSVYKQILVGARSATTDYVGLAEDDTLYAPVHFSNRNFPSLNMFAYNMCRWSVCTWLKNPVYSMTNRLCNSNLIAPRKLLVDLLETRLSRFKDKEPDKLWSEPAKHDAKYGITTGSVFRFMTTPTIGFIHPESLGFDRLGKRKGISPMRAFNIPYWGEVKELMGYYYAN